MSFETPARVIHFLALAATFGGSFVFIWRILPHPAGFLSMLGRNSLHVFCVGSLLSLAGQIVRFVYGNSVWVDSVVLVLGIAVLGFTAWVSELRERLRPRAGEDLGASPSSPRSSSEPPRPGRRNNRRRRP